MWDMTRIPRIARDQVRHVADDKKLGPGQSGFPKKKVREQPKIWATGIAGTNDVRVVPPIPGLQYTIDHDTLLLGTLAFHPRSRIESTFF